MKYFKRKKIFSHYSLEQNNCFESKSNTLYNYNNKSSIDNENRVEQNAMTTLRESKLPVVLVQKLNIGEKIYADGKEVGISVSEEDCDTPELYVFSSDDINCSLNNEKEAPELKKNIFQCSFCIYRTHKKGHLDQHQLVHSDVKLFSCSQCSYKSKRKNNLKNHALRHSSSSANLLECVKCNFKTTFSSQFKKHMSQHSSVDKLDCGDDDYSENNKSSVDEVPNSENRANLFICSKCEYKTKYRGCLTRHMLRHADLQPSNEDELDCEEFGNDNQESDSKGIKKFKCSMCKFETIYKNNLARHMQKKHPDVEPSHRSENDFVTNEKNKLKCLEANFKTIPNMLEHSSDDKLECEENGIENQENDADKMSNVKDIKKLFRCSKCDFESKWKKSVDRHMSKKHLEKAPLHCIKCAFTTNEKSKLECHVLSHCETKLSNCSSSDFKTEFTETFDAHQESNHIENSDEDSQSSDNSKPTTDDTQHPDTPSGEEDLMWHECPYCEYRTKKSHYFNRHMHHHSTSRYKCEFCNYKTNKKASFATHLNTHEAPISFSNSEEVANETLLECPDCSFKTKRKSAFITHISQHTNKTLLNCFECDFQTRNEDELDSHILSHTKTKNVERHISNLESENDLKTPRLKRVKVEHTKTKNVESHISNLESEKNDLKTPRLKRVKVERILPNGNNVMEEEEPKSEIRWYNCPNCDFKANNKRFLDSHLRTHFGKKSVHECSICSYRTVSKQNLKVHMFKHSNFNLKIYIFKSQDECNKISDMI